MDFPETLWTDDLERQLAADVAVLFSAEPLMVTDRLGNSVYLNDAAATIFGDRPDALVNRLSFSLLGFGSRDTTPRTLVAALLGEGDSWRGVVNVSDEAAGARWHFAEASAVHSPQGFVCGVVRLSKNEVAGGALPT